MSSNPKITVIIPTRERCDVLAKSLCTAVAQDYDNLEILVSDNCSQDATQEVVRSFRDSRIRYINTGRRVSMAHNWEFALSSVLEGWITVMGDDDGLLPEAAIDAADIIKTTGQKAIRSAFCVYDWPATAQNRHGELIVPMGHGLSIRNSATWLGKVMSGAQKYTQLPMIYNGGFVDISLFHEIKNRTGAFFLSSSPDVYSAVAIASIVKSYAYSAKPLSISGTSAHSTGASFYATGKRRNADPGRAFSSEQNLPFHPDVPLTQDGGYPLSLHALVYEAYLQSRSLRPHASELDRAQQLRIILAGAGPHYESLKAWGRLFADAHGVDYEAVVRSMSYHRPLARTQMLARKILAASRSIITRDMPIKDVFEASVAAGVIRARPGKLSTLKFLAGRALKPAAR